MEKKNTAGNKKKIGIIVGVLVIVVVAVAAGILIRNKMVEKAKLQEAINQQSGSDYVATKCVTLGKYKNRKVSLKVTEDDLNTEIDSLLEEYTTYEQKKGVAKDGDKVYAEFEGYIDGKKVDSTCGSDYISIGEKEWLEDFENAIIGMKTGTTKKFSVDVPEGTYGDEQIDGHTVEFHLTLKYICGEEIVPEYNDEFVESVSDYSTTAEHKAYLKKKLEKENEEDKEEYAWSEVVEASKVKKYPKSLLKIARQEVLKGYYDMADMYGQTHDEIFQQFGCQDEQDFIDTQLEDLAKDTAKEYLISEAIGEKEYIIRNQKDYEKLLKEEYEDNKDSYKDKAEFEKKNKKYIERYALINKVKSWVSKKTEYTK